MTRQVPEAAAREAPAATAPGRLHLWIWVGVVLTPFSVWLTGQVFRDATWLTGLCFYLPSPLAAAWLLGMAFAAWRWGGRRVALAAALLGAAPVAFVAGVENRWTYPESPPAPPDSLRLMHWNVWYGGFDWPTIEKTLLDARCDLLVLSESPGGARQRRLAEALGDEYTLLVQDELAVLGRGKLAREDYLTAGRAEALVVRWESPRGTLKLLVVDLPSSLALARDPMLGWVGEQIERTQPDLVLGDFNAPRRSRGLNRLPPGYVHAYEQAGAGWSYTWPMPLPMWAIDQCIVGPRVVPVRYELGGSAASDHRSQSLVFFVRPP